jgi:hypothetical protein
VHRNTQRRKAMGVLKRKGEATATVTVRVPVSVKGTLDRLREETASAGFDLNGTLTEAVVRVTRQMREELEQLKSTRPGASRPNGLAGRDGATG